MRMDLRVSGNAFCSALAVAMLGTLLMSFFHQVLEFQVFYILLGMASAMPVVPRGLKLLRGPPLVSGRAQELDRPALVISLSPSGQRLP